MSLSHLVEPLRLFHPTRLHYACCVVVANGAAGKSGDTITMADIEKNLKSGMQQVGNLLASLMSFNWR